jgi:hypothetical protein
MPQRGAGLRNPLPYPVLLSRRLCHPTRKSLERSSPATVDMQANEDKLLLRITAWRPWGDPITDFNLLIALNTDEAVTTGALEGAE